MGLRWCSGQTTGLSPLRFRVRSPVRFILMWSRTQSSCDWVRGFSPGAPVSSTDLNYWIKLLSCIIEANGGHIGLSHINLHWYY